MGSIAEPDPFAALRAAAARVAAAGDAVGVRAGVAAGSLAVLGLKAHNRDVYERLEARRADTAAAKAALEKTNLQLQNLQYEKSHYAQEIKTCRDFRSAVADADVALAPEDDFLRRAPPELNPPGGAPDAHARMLNRLAFELAERQELRVQLQELKARKKALAETNTSRRKLILALATELKAIKAATAPLSRLLELPDRSGAHLLPAPLRALLAALDGVPQPAAEAGRRFVVSVSGTPPDAAAAAAAEAEAEAPGDAAEAGEAKEEAEEEEGGARRAGKRARTGAAAWEAHPMAVLLELHARGARRAAVAFHFYPGRGAVSARVEEGDAALLQGVLGEGDAPGAAPPDADADAEEEEEEGAAPAEAAAPALRQWAQKLAGLDAGGDAAHAAAVVTALLAAAAG